MLLFRLGGDPGAGERAAGKRAAPASGDRCIAAKPWHIRHLAAALGTPCSPPDHSFDAPVQAPAAACGAVPLCEKEARLKLCERGQLFQRTGSVVSNVQIVQWLQEAEPTVNAPMPATKRYYSTLLQKSQQKDEFQGSGFRTKHLPRSMFSRVETHHSSLLARLYMVSAFSRCTA